MKIIHTDDFLKELSRLPIEIKDLLLVQEERLKANRRDPRLHIKKVRSLDRVFSFRVTRRYRVFFYSQDDQTIIFFDIDHRKDAYRKI